MVYRIMVYSNFSYNANTPSRKSIYGESDYAKSAGQIPASEARLEACQNSGSAQFIEDKN